MPDRIVGGGLGVGKGLLDLALGEDVPGYVTIASPFDGEYLRLLLDESPPAPSGDFGGWETVTISRKRPIRYWAANPENKFVIGVVVEKGQESVTAQLRTLREWGTGTEKRRPRQLELSGPLPPLPIDRWVIDDVQFRTDPDGALYTDRDHLIRQYLSITFGEPPTLDAIEVRRGGRSKRRTSSGKKTVRYERIRKGETLQQFAARTLGSPQRWKDIAEIQKPKITDPRRVKDGRKLRLP